MNNVFHYYIVVFVVVYLGDVVIDGESLEEHLHYLRLMLYGLREHQLYVKLEKCEFSQRTILFLMHQVSHGKVRMH